MKAPVGQARGAAGGGLVRLGLVRAAFFSRLAIALLVMFGFASPVAERQVDAQVQTRQVSAPRTVEVAHEAAAQVLAEARAPELTREAPADLPTPSRKRYLEHRAWLI
jgi:hypothetical protein